MKLGFFDRFSKKSSNIKFHDNPFSGCRVVQCGRTDMTKLIIAFHNFANAPKNDWMIGPVWTVMRGFENILQLGSWTLKCWLVGLTFARAMVGLTGSRYWYFLHCAWTVQYSSFSILTCHGLDDPESISDKCKDFYVSSSISYWGYTPPGKGKAWSGPEGSRKLKFPDFMTTAQDGGKDLSLTHRPPLPKGNTPGTHFC